MATTYPIDTAAVSWTDNQGVHIRIYTSDGYTVTEQCADPGANWTAGIFSQPGSAVAATCWQAGGGVYIRVYCTFEDATTEWCSDPDKQWYRGAFPG